MLWWGGVDLLISRTLSSVYARSIVAGSTSAISGAGCSCSVGFVLAAMPMSWAMGSGDRSI